MSSVLTAYGVDALHMKEYAHSTKGSVFDSWKGDTVKRNGFMGAVTDVINTCGLQSVSVTMLLNAYDVAILKSRMVSLLCAAL